MANCPVSLHQPRQSPLQHIFHKFLLLNPPSPDRQADVQTGSRRLANWNINDCPTHHSCWHNGRSLALYWTWWRLDTLFLHCSPIRWSWDFFSKFCPLVAGASIPPWRIWGFWQALPHPWLGQYDIKSFHTHQQLFQNIIMAFMFSSEHSPGQNH